MPMRAKSERLPTAGGRVRLQMISLLRRTMIPGVFEPLSSRKLSFGAKIAHNSFAWRILQITSLL